MSYMYEANKRGKFADRPRSFYAQWGMEASRLVSTGRYRGDTGDLADLYLIRPREDIKLMRVGMTVRDLLACLAVVAAIGVYAYALGPGMDRCIEVLGW